ncbi:MAG TPA: hypothetical protein VFR86_05620, partial [Burkholderiaceae bacterium]|nr:hypothetical protein [Burkholderiaceae bacterium]
CTRDLVQARVIAKDEASALLTLFPNLAVSLPLNAQYLDANEALTTRAEFLAAITAAGIGNQGTLVKIRGKFAAATLTAEEAEIKN